MSNRPSLLRIVTRLTRGKPKEIDFPGYHHFGINGRSIEHIYIRDFFIIKMLKETIRYMI